MIHLTLPQPSCEGTNGGGELRGEASLFASIDTSWGKP